MQRNMSYAIIIVHKLYIILIQVVIVYLTGILTYIPSNMYLYIVQIAILTKQIPTFLNFHKEKKTAREKEFSLG